MRRDQEFSFTPQPRKKRLALTFIQSLKVSRSHLKQFQEKHSPGKKFCVNFGDIPSDPTPRLCLCLLRGCSSGRMQSWAEERNQPKEGAHLGVRQGEGAKGMCSGGRNEPRPVLPCWRVIWGHFFWAFWKNRPWVRDLKICFKGVYLKGRLFLELKLNFRNPELKE